MERYATEQIGGLLARPDRKDERRRFGNLAGMRQWIEAIYGTPTGQLHLERHGGRTPPGPASAPPSGCSPGRRYLAQLDHQHY
jgi:hypothetical protein